MRGYVPTPPRIVDLMVARLFERRRPSGAMRLLDPGCGEGAFIEGVVRWCVAHECPLPQIVGIEQHPGRSGEARRRFSGVEQIRILTEDFLRVGSEPFDFVVGNPPYVAITGLDAGEKAWYRGKFRTATGRFDLYVLFWEQALRMLKPGGRLVFVTPEKFLTVESARALRRLLAAESVPEILLLNEDAFPGLTTYPTVTTVDRLAPSAPTRLLLRDGTERAVQFSADGRSLAPSMYGDGGVEDGRLRLGDVCTRISCGVATGGDRHFIRRTADLAPGLRPYAHPTLSGRQLAPGRDGFEQVDSMLIPYDRYGRLIEFDRLTDSFAAYLEQRKASLLSRTCTSQKPWYAFHETPPMGALLRPKILCKDVTEQPQFWVDAEGTIVPRHSVYYIVPMDADAVPDLAAYLNGPVAREWLMAHCQRVRKGFIRLQSRVIKQLPVPSEFVPAVHYPLLASLTA